MVKLRQADGEVTVKEEAAKQSAVARIAWFLAHLIAGVMVFGAVFWLRPDLFQKQDPPERRLPRPQPLEAATPGSLVPVESVADAEPVDQLARADRLLESGGYTMAMQIYNELAADRPASGDPSLDLRRALCLELVGELDQAFALYQSLMESDDRLSTAAAQLGLGRIWYRKGKAGPTRSLPYPLALSAGDDETESVTAFHLLASLSVSDAFEPETDLLKEQAVITPDPLASVDWLLDSVDRQDAPTTNTQVVESEVVERFGSDVSEIRLGLYKNSVGLGSLLQKLADKARLSVEPTSAARKILNARSVSVNVRDIDFATWLDAILEPTGLVWEQADEVLHVRLATEISRSKLSEFRRSQAERLCRSALTLYPEHSLAVKTFLVLGNIHFWSGNYVDAANAYHEIVRRASDTGILRTAWFNLSRAEFQENDFDAVRQAIYKFVDLSRGHAHESLGYLYLGRQFLDDGQPENASRQFARAIAVARDNEVKRFAAESLATAYLISENPLAANMTLMDHRDILRGEPFESKAAFLSALARYRAASHPRERLRMGRSLASAVAHVDVNRFFCFAAHKLVGEAYDEIGLPNQTQAIFAEALRGARPHDVRDELMFKLGRRYVEDGKLADGQQMMQQLVDEGHEPWALQARFFLATLALRSRDFDDCLRRCAEILELQLTVDEKANVLTLMGRVYEMNLDHYKAALCFAGLLPTATSGDAPVDRLEPISD